ncbi:phosphoglycerate dehydrogenase [Natroniella sp. ANB-PHB2]|uniref:phosphoglycerate dehydrogenase n=1 Tax=Natroniella sp. ANB-PHB2 TaxID=3384444 RepID=UPI0038D3F2DE
MKVLVSDEISEAGIEILEKKGVDVTYNTELGYEELLEEIGKYHGIILRSMTPLNEEVLAKADNLKVIARAGSGYDNIDVEAASKKGIIVLNTPGQNTISAAEQTMALMAGLSRNIYHANKALHEGVWNRSKYMGVELNQKTLGIIGLGRVGGNVAKMAQGFNMKVIANDPYIPAKRGERLGVELVEFDELLERADYITLHTPLTEETHHIIDKEAISKMKDGVRILNVARGQNVDCQALYHGVKSGKVAGAGLDVHEEEPITEDYSLLELEDKVIMAPHLGGTTVEAMDNVSIDAARQMLSVFEGDLPRTPLNIPSVDPKVMAEIKPYINLADKLGSFYSGWTGGRVEEVEVIYQGDIAKQEVEPITTAVLKGLLNPVVNEDINLVNAQMIAEERGIKVVESKSKTSNKYSNLITLKVKDKDEMTKLSGTVFHKGDLRIVDIDGYQADIIPEGILLVSDHIDKPGVVGQVGTLFGSNDVNIASMRLGRNQAGGRAIMVLTLDDEPREELKDELLKIDGIKDINVFAL